MPAQAIALAAAGEPGESRWTWDHPLAAVAARTCQTHSAVPADLIGGVACAPCWQFVLITDLVFAIENDLSRELEVDASYVDEVAVERAMRGEALELTALERVEVRRRLAEVRDRRNRSYRFVCSRAAAARAVRR
jgi:hypothetical protein